MYDVTPTDDGLDATRARLRVYDPESRVMIAQGDVNMGSSSCPVRWYGEPEAAVCF